MIHKIFFFILIFQLKEAMMERNSILLKEMTALQKRKSERSIPSIRKILILLLCLLLPVLVLSVTFLVQRLTRAEETAISQAEHTVSATLSSLEDAFSAANFYLSDLLLNNSDIQTAETETDTMIVNTALRALGKTFDTQARYIPTPFTYYYYNANHGIGVRWLAASADYRDYFAMRQRLTEKYTQGTLNTRAEQWSFELLGDHFFFVKTYRTAHGYIACWAPSDTLLAAMDGQLLSSGGTRAILTTDGAVLEGADALDACGIALEGNAVQSSGSLHLLRHAVPRCDLQLLVAMKPLIDTEDITTFLVFMALILLILLGFTTYTLFYFSHYIARPFAHFRAHIASYAAKAPKKRGPGFQELNEAVDAFDALTEQLNALKISIYEERIALAKTELEYFQLQIKPHFFANCFGVIYNLAEEECFDTIQSFCLSLTNYVRYLFRDGLSTVTLKEELRLTREYLTIQNTRFRVHTFLCDNIPEALLSAKLPPLLLLTFVENAVKHTQNRFDLGVVVDAEILSRDGRTWLGLSVTDNGPGVPEEKLQSLNSIDTRAELRLADCMTETNVGIRNIAKRLYLIYGGAFSMRFENADAETGHSGLCVRLEIPWLAKPKDEE